MKVLNKDQKNNMKHSSSWPERAVTVKLQVDSVSRAYKILQEEPHRILTSENDIHKLEKLVSATKTNNIKFNILSNNEFDNIKKNSVESLNQNTEFTDDFIEINNSNLAITNDLLAPTKPVTPSIENTCSTDGFINEKNTDIIVSVNIENSNALEKNISTNLNDSTKPPVIKIIDYDDAGTSNNWESRHACAKCKSDSYLELQVDPFRTPIELPKNKKNYVESGTFTDRRYRSRSTTYDFRPGLDKTFGRRTKSFGGEFKDRIDTHELLPLSRPTIDHRKEITLRRHYYPEGGWGYIIVTCSALVHFIGIGLQLAAPGTFHISAELKFHHPPLHSAGKNNNKYLTKV